MASGIKACTRPGYRRKNTVMILLITLLSFFALVMVIYNLIKGSYLFSLAWFIATILASTYVLIRINTVYPTYIVSDRSNIYMKNWTNDFFPYDYDHKIKILSEFIPAKTKIVEIPMDEIRMVLIGTKNFIKRNIDSKMGFVENVKSLEKSKDFYRKRTISTMDIFYVETYDRECYYMPIVKFDSKDVIKIVQSIQRKNPDTTVKSSSKDYRALRAPRR